MFIYLPTKPTVTKKLQKYSLEKKYTKQLELLCENPKHPSLHTELLAPKQYGIYSFRIDRKFRALFIFHPNKSAIDVLNITVHYK